MRWYYFLSEVEERVVAPRLHALVAVLVCVLAGCSAAFYAYKEDMFQGKRLLEAGQFGKAREAFVRAAAASPSATAFAFAATASYKMNDLPAAEGFINQALKLTGGGYSCLRILGYRALILYGEGRTTEGRESLNLYLQVYAGRYPLKSIEEVKAMEQRGDIDLPRLAALIDEQVKWFEREVDQYREAATGFYDRPPTLRSW